MNHPVADTAIDQLIDEHNQLMQHLRELQIEKLNVIQAASSIRTKLADYLAKHPDNPNPEHRDKIIDILASYEGTFVNQTAARPTNGR